MVARVTGRQLNAAWRVAAQHALYRKDGTWYHLLKHFPGALFDAHGYVLFENKSDLMACPGMLMGEAKTG
jgi:5-methylcytosine-specific restriction protein A